MSKSTAEIRNLFQSSAVRAEFDALDKMLGHPQWTYDPADTWNSKEGVRVALYANVEGINSPEDTKTTSIRPGSGTTLEKAFDVARTRILEAGPLVIVGARTENKKIIKLF